MRSCILIVLDEFSDLVDLGALVATGGCACSFEDQKGGHGGYFEHVLNFLALVAVDVDEGVICSELLGKSSHINLDSLTGATPRCGHLDEAFLVSGSHDGGPEFAGVLGAYKGHV